MKKPLIICFAVMGLLMSSCRSYYPASSENAYQECVDQIQAIMDKDDYHLVGKSIQKGYHDRETYQFRNMENDTAQFIIELHRGECNGDIFVDEVSLQGCSTSKANQFERYCGDDGVPTRAIKRMKQDTTGSTFSPGKTVGAVLGGSFGVGVLLGILLAILVPDRTV